MMRYVLLALGLSGAVVAEETLRTAPGLGFAAPNAGLLLVVLYALKGDPRDLWPLALLAGVIRGSLAPEPAGFFVLAYLAAAWLVIRLRWALFVERAATQLAVTAVAGLILQAGHGLFWALGTARPESVAAAAAPFCSSLTAGLLLPGTVAVFDRWRFLQMLLRR